jgi:hypothetical protein
VGASWPPGRTATGAASGRRAYLPLMPQDSAYRNAVLTDNPLAYWRLGESVGAVAVDELVAHSGAYAGRPVLGQPGALAGDADAAAAFGAGAYAVVAYSAALNPRAFSVEVWAYPTGAAGTYRGVLASRDYPYGWVLYAGRDDAWQFWINDDPAAMLVIRGPAVVLNRWTHLVGTFDGTTARLYVNGALVALGTPSSYTPNATQPLTIGQGPPGNGFFFPGKLDEVALYGAALSAAQVQNHHRIGATGA